MGFERSALFRKLELDCELDGSVQLTFSTERPGEAMAVRVQKLLAATSGRDTVTVQLAGEVRGHLYRVKIGGTAAVARIFGARVYAKVLDGSSRTGWQWHPIPIEPTPKGWQTVSLPIEPTEAGWRTIALPIVPTAPEFQTLGLPMRESPPRGTWIDVPLDD